MNTEIAWRSLNLLIFQICQIFSCRLLLGLEYDEFDSKEFTKTIEFMANNYEDDKNSMIAITERGKTIVFEL